MSDYCLSLKGHVLEYIEESHIYLVDGVIVPSITQMLKAKFPRKYAGISQGVLQEAARKGTAVHDAIEAWCKFGVESDLPEVRNFKFLQMKYGFRVLENEVPVILFNDDEPIAAGRLDMVMVLDDQVGGADIKRTSVLDKEYLAYQLNLYRMAYGQCYGVWWLFLKGIHLREDTRKLVNIPINEEATLHFIKEWCDGKYREDNPDSEGH